MHPAPRDVRVHARSADVFSEPIHDQQVNVIEGQLWHQTFGFPEQFAFALLQFLRRQNCQGGRVMELILHDPHSAEHRRRAQRHSSNGAQDVFVSEPRGGKMKIRRPNPLSQADDQHLQHSATQ